MINEYLYQQYLIWLSYEKYIYSHTTPTTLTKNTVLFKRYKKFSTETMSYAARDECL